MLKVAIEKFYKSFFAAKDLMYPSTAQNDPLQKHLHEYYINKALADKFSAAADENKEAIQMLYAGKMDDLRRDTNRFDEKQEFAEQIGSFVLSFSSKRASNLLDQTKLKTALRLKGIKDNVINEAFETATAKAKVPVSMSVVEVNNER